MLKAKYKSKPCRLIFGKSRFGHVFGGAPIHRGSTPAGCSVPLHRVLTLDLSDPLVPVEVSGRRLRFLPLYYPLRYGVGGGKAQYRVVSDVSIELLDISKGGPDTEQYPLMDQFPERPFHLKPFSYEQYRALLMAEEGEGFKPSRSDREHLEVVDQDHLVQIGGNVSPIGGDMGGQCRNPKCSWAGSVVTFDVFARVSATPAPDIQMFGEWGTDVEICFGLCRGCGTIVTQNRCT